MTSEVKAFIAPLRTEVENLTLRMSAYDLGTPTATPQTAKFDPSDPAHKQVTLSGFPLDDVRDRLRAMAEYVSNFPNFTPKFGNCYTGPYGTGRKLKSDGFLEFTNQDQRREFLDEAKNRSLQPFLYQGSSIAVKPTTSKINKKRTYLLFEAERLIKGSCASAGKNVSTCKTERVVTVDGDIAFAQGKEDLGGTFRAPYTQLQLPV